MTCDSTIFYTLGTLSRLKQKQFSGNVNKLTQVTSFKILKWYKMSTAYNMKIIYSIVSMNWLFYKALCLIQQKSPMIIIVNLKKSQSIVWPASS